DPAREPARYDLSVRVEDTTERDRDRPGLEPTARNRPEPRGAWRISPRKSVALREWEHLASDREGRLANLQVRRPGPTVPRTIGAPWRSFRVTGPRATAEDHLCWRTGEHSWRCARCRILKDRVGNLMGS